MSISVRSGVKSQAWRRKEKGTGEGSRDTQVRLVGSENGSERQEKTELPAKGEEANYLSSFPVYNGLRAFSRHSCFIDTSIGHQPGY